MEFPSIKCPQCGMANHHTIDIKHRYCGNCDEWYDEMDNLDHHNHLIGYLKNFKNYVIILSDNPISLTLPDVEGSRVIMEKGETMINEWISVKDRLPKYYQRVLIFRGNYDSDDKDEIIHVGFLHPKDGFYGSQYGLLDDELYPHTLVTYWMPLPKVPE